ncbi:hypothetical protein Poly59_14280 [Rubripirellula reticaptiva]|uniref:Uncharacterized protein n=2 Tax=Rubripirellula reticaptiva TaxID=2528013 RepID=A0A5C6F1K0_9BACT|nr:hypothetical protein Poly59_14280 [Rubripirellula reticaptiva]
MPSLRFEINKEGKLDDHQQPRRHLGDQNRKFEIFADGRIVSVTELEFAIDDTDSSANAMFFVMVKGLADEQAGPVEVFVKVVVDGKSIGKRPISALLENVS